jgi:pyruvate-ferredoxin/flavodoxin oxidoreductase
VRDLRERRLDPDRPVLRGTAQNPDVFFQAREAANPFHDAVPEIVSEVFDELAAVTGRNYSLVDYEGAPDAERVIVMMGSGSGAAGEAVAQMAADEKVGLVTIRLFRPFPTDALLAALPSTVRSIAVLDRTKEPGSVGEPLLQDVVTTLADAGRGNVRTIGGRYGLGSKEFTPAMAKAVLDEAAVAADGGPTRRRFTVGIVDDVGDTSLDVDDSFRISDDRKTAIFYALGSDGTVGANKATVKILGSRAGTHAQGYFVYDSKKSGSMTVSHLRVGHHPIRSTYLVQEADLVACHQFGLLDRFDVLGRVKPGGTFLLNAPYPADEVWDHLPPVIQHEIVERRLRVFTIDAARIAREEGLAGRINTIMQPCYFALADVMPVGEAIDEIKASVEHAYGRRGRLIVERNSAAIDRALDGLTEIRVPTTASTPPLAAAGPHAAAIERAAAAGASFA